MSFENLVREISELEDDIKFLSDIKKDTENSDPANLSAVRALDGAIRRSEEKLEELKNMKDTTTPCTDENDIKE